MIRFIPAVDMQGNQVVVGDTIMYLTCQYNEIIPHYAKVMDYLLTHRQYYDHPVYRMKVKLLSTELKYSSRILSNPTFLKCGVELFIPTDTQIQGMQL